MIETMLTTVDNPFDPFTQWASWYAFDLRLGYNTPSFLSRLVETSDSLTDEENEELVVAAIDEIVKENVLGVYRKVTREV